MSSIKSEKKGGIKSKIICKYFIQGKCTKGDSCPYLHSKVEKPKEITQIECPMYNIGFCKNGRNCHFLHIKKDKYIEEKSEDKNTNATNSSNEENKESDNNNKNDPNESDVLMKEEKEEKVEIKKKDENEIKDEKEETEIKEDKEEIKYPEIPIWYLEHYFDKPIPLIFSELEQKNSPEIAELKKKYGFTNIQPNLPVFPTPNKKNKMNLNMNTFNLNFNNFNMNYAFNNNKTDINNKTNFNIIQNALQANGLKMSQNMQDKNYDKYELKKNKIEFLINKQDNIFYYLIKCQNLEEIKKSQETNSILLPSLLYEKYKNIEIQKTTVIIIICDDEFQNFSGFARLKKPLISDKKEEENLFLIEWLWRTKLSLSKVGHIMNKADNDHFLHEGKNGCEIDKDFGNFCCRYMMKRLSKDEINELVSEKKIFDSEKKLMQINQEKYNNRISSNYNINSSKNNINREIYSEKDSPYKNKYSFKKNDTLNTNSTKYSDYNKYEKDKIKDKDYKDHKYSGYKRYRNDSLSLSKSRSRSRSRSKSRNKRENSEDYSKHYNNKYEDKKYNNYKSYKSNGNNSYNYKNSNNKIHSNQRNYKDYKDNNAYHRHKYEEHRNDYSNRKYYK